MGQDLYKQGYSNALLRCVIKDEVKYVMNKIEGAIDSRREGVEWSLQT